MSAASGLDYQRTAVLDRRRAAVLMPLSSLDQGDGATGREARHFIDWLAEAGFSVWQLLPLGPTGADGSPYWLRSDHASATRLLDRRDYAEAEHEIARPGTALHESYAAWSAEERDWIDDYALFEALSQAADRVPWYDWPRALRDRDPDALREAAVTHAQAIERIRIAQFLFDHAWAALRCYARERGVRLFGDVPIYIAPDAAETWQHRDAFQLDAGGRPSAVAGVPPDYFAADGQLWGNPLYDWHALARSGFAFWRKRVRRALERFDLLRIDHFRGLAAYWSVPAGSPNARHGEWREAPGGELLTTLIADAPDAPFVAEDLGLITPDVEALRQRFALPGMRVLQFGFDGNPSNLHLPHEHPRECVVYTGTHDNDTTHGWAHSLDTAARERVAFYLGVDVPAIPDAMVRAALGSVAQLAVLPIADLLGLGSDARINTPGTVEGNWSWRLPADALDAGLAARLRALNHVYARIDDRSS